MIILWILIGICILGMIVSAYGLGEYRASKRYYFPLTIEGSENDVKPQVEPIPEVSLYLATHTGEINVIPSPPTGPIVLPHLGVDDVIEIRSEVEVIRELREQVTELESELTKERQLCAHIKRIKQMHWRTIERLRVQLKAIESVNESLSVQHILNWSYYRSLQEVKREKIFRLSFQQWNRAMVWEKEAALCLS